MSRCDDKVVTRRLMLKAGLKVPAQRWPARAEENAAFLKEHGAIVVKPARGEQGKGITVDVTTEEEVARAVAEARNHAETVLLEQFFQGDDLRIIVIDYQVVAAAIRRPAEVAGDRRAYGRGADRGAEPAAVGGHRRREQDPDGRGNRALRRRRNGYSMDDVLPEGTVLPVRKTANLHTGGTIHDVTDRLHRTWSMRRSPGPRRWTSPWSGFDFLVPSVTKPDYVIIEANERPGLANHEPQPTAERFVDLLFPNTKLLSNG